MLVTRSERLLQTRVMLWRVVPRAAAIYGLEREICIPKLLSYFLLTFAGGADRVQTLTGVLAQRVFSRSILVFEQISAESVDGGIQLARPLVVLER